MSTFPFFAQLDGMDCGPACLRMICAYHDRQFSQSWIRELCEIGKGGVSILGISEAAEKIGFRCLAVRLPFGRFREEAPLPCIAHWQHDHFVVVYEVTRRKVRVADPAHGLVDYTHEEFIAGTSIPGGPETAATPGIFLLLEATPELHQRNSSGQVENEDTRRGLLFFYSYLKPHRKLLVQLILGMLVGLMLELILPFLSQAVVDYGIGNLDLQFIYVLLAAQLVLSVSQTAADMIRSWLLLHIGSRISISMISDFLHKLLRLPLPFFDSRTAGDIMQRVSDHRRVKSFLMSSSLDIVFSLLSFVVFGGVLALYSLKILAVFLIMTALSVGWLCLFLKKRRMLDYKRFTLEAKERDTLYEIVSSMQEIKTQGIQRDKRWDWEELGVRNYRLERSSLSLRQFQRIGTFFINNLRNIFINFIAASAVIGGEMTLGMMLATTYIVGQLNSPITRLIDFLHSGQDARLSLERMQEIYGQKDDGEELSNAPGHVPYPASRILTLHQLSFRYPGAGQTDVLSGINLTIPEGKVTAIVGSSGSGKTTLLKLMLGLYKPTAGGIYIGHLPLEGFDMDTWRTRCGSVMQDGVIFSASLARNIAPGRSRIDPIRLEGAIWLANLGDYVATLPLGTETRIGPEGQGLSGGQKQRILIARALYRNPEFLFLDEATSALDANNESTILGHLRNYIQGRTVVVIAHRLSTVRDADQIVVLHGGKIVEIGAHEDLVARGGAYFNLVRNQLELEQDHAVAYR